MPVDEKTGPTPYLVARCAYIDPITAFIQAVYPTTRSGDREKNLTATKEIKERFLFIILGSVHKLFFIKYIINFLHSYYNVLYS